MENLLPLLSLFRFILRLLLQIYLLGVFDNRVRHKNGDINPQREGLGLFVKESTAHADMTIGLDMSLPPLGLVVLDSRAQLLVSERSQCLQFPHRSPSGHVASRFLPDHPEKF